MAKRFTETTKWDNPWFLDLTSNGKLGWMYLLDKCDNAGVVHVHLGKAQFETGIECFQTVIDELMGSDHLERLENGKYHIPSFVSFQFGELRPNSNLHKNVIKALQSHGLPYPCDTLDEGLAKGPSKGKGNGNGNGKYKNWQKEELERARERIKEDEQNGIY